MKKPSVIRRSIMRRKICRMVGMPSFDLPAYPWLVELIRVQGFPLHEQQNERLMLRWNQTEVTFNHL